MARDMADRELAKPIYKDKIEVSLDGPQIFYLFFGGAVIVGLVFVLGVMVGRRVEARGHVERAHVEAAVDPLAALDRLEAGNGTTFQGALRGDPKPAAVDAKIAAMAEDRRPASGVRPPTADKKPEEPKPATDKKVEDKKPEVADKKPDDKKPEVADKKPDDKKLDDKKLEKKPEEKKPRYTLQLSSFQDKGEADSYMQSIKSAGFSAFVTEGEVDGKQYFRVRLGSYRSLDAANDAKSDFEKATKKSALVTKL